MSRVVRSALLGWVVVAACAFGVAPGVALAAPDLSLSRLSCHPENAIPPLLGSTRPGDYVVCQLKAANMTSDIAYAVTAEISIPSSTTFAPLPNAQGVPLPAGAPTKVYFDTTKLGLIDASNPKPATIRLRVADGALPGTPIQPVATVMDPAATTYVTEANLLSVMPQRADLTPTDTVCVKAAPVGDGKVRPGDSIDCTIRVQNKALREDAVDVSLNAGIPNGTERVAGGNESLVFGPSMTWYSSVLAGGAPSGTVATPDLRTRLRVLPTTLGGTVLYVTGTLSWKNALSGDLDSTGVGSGPIPITPGPASLTASTLACADDDGPPLVANDLVNCTVVVRPAAGHEDLADAGGGADVVALTDAVTPTNATGKIGLVGVSGTIAAGTQRSAIYRLRVASNAVAGNVIVPTAVVTGRSADSDDAVSQPLVGNQLVVGAKPVVATPGKAVTPAGTVAAAGTTTTSRGPVICGSKRVVVVNVKPPKGKRWKSVAFTFAKKTVKGKKATGTRGKKGYFTAKLVFQGLPKGELKVAVKGVTTKGKTVKSSRTYHLCTKA
ncbi:hypothetical protein [Baekduia sp. Peel2402]|uniref:hypothetical protein n=1 Tax=Baekduia sp. Peel2402 TaxID=3458296 RepID=UPI00403E4EE3